jgi:hypothetical protein
MKLNFGSDFTILRVVGVFISLMIVHRVYEIMQSYSPGSMAVLSPVDILILFISIFIVIYCFTMYWKVELIHDSIVSSYGFCLWHKKKAYQNISQIKFEVNFIEVKNGPDKAYISVTIKPEKRDRPYPVCSLYQLRHSLLFKSHYKKKHAHQIRQFQNDVDRLVALYPNIPITIDEKVPDFYQSITSESFRWGKG